MSTGPSRDIKRKLSPQRTINGLQIANVVQHLVKDGLKQVNESNEAGPSALQIENVPFRPGKEVTSFKANDRDRPSNARLNLTCPTRKPQLRVRRVQPEAGHHMLLELTSLRKKKHLAHHCYLTLREKACTKERKEVMGNRELLVSFSSQPGLKQRWAIKLEGILVERPEVVFAEIRVHTTRAMGWFNKKLKLAWKLTFPLMERSVEKGSLMCLDSV